MGLFAAWEVSATGLAAQRQRVELLVQNLANSETTRTPEGGPYRRRDAVFQSEPAPMSFSSALARAFGEPLVGVAVSEIVIDDSEPDRRYLPGHPDADAQGYVAFPHISPAEDMVDLTGAVRSFQANLAAMGAVREMLQRSLDLIR
jgi:flagellar basal-body rod protein FlgC